MSFWKKIFLNQFFFIALFSVIILFVFGFFFPLIFTVAQLALLVLFFLALIDLILLFSSKKGVSGKREVNEKFSNNDENAVRIHLKNHFKYKISYTIYDEIPAQFQWFDFKLKGKLKVESKDIITYYLSPKSRGVYSFNNINIFIKSPLNLLIRKIVLPTNNQVKVYPSYLKLSQFSLHNFKYHRNEFGVKKVRRIGQSMEFEQIKNYVQGDDIRNINWKTTAKHQKLMVNQFIDEKSQQIYCVIDKGRVMKMPFNGLSLLDYAINSSLILSNIIVQNQDRAGLFTFSSQIENLVKAERRNSQMGKILETLYSVNTDFKESDFGKLYSGIKHKITQRGLIVLFTNFESMDSLHRQLPYLKGINKNHLLIVVFFKNTELEEFVNNSTINEGNIYEIAVAEKFLYEKRQIVKELNKNGIQTVLTHPKDLTVNTINKYLEVKSKAQI